MKGLNQYRFCCEVSKSFQLILTIRTDVHLSASSSLDSQVGVLTNSYQFGLKDCCVVLLLSCSNTPVPGPTKFLDPSLNQSSPLLGMIRLLPV